MRAIAVVCLLVGLLSPVSVRAWGSAAHRFIMAEAIFRLPDELRPFYEENRTYLIEYSILPDVLRNLDVADEAPRHYLDMDAYGEYPFDALPRDYDEAVSKFGRETIENNGVLPWRAAEVFERLVSAFERAGRREGRSLEEIKLMSAVLAHYVADAHVPFHAIVNYDGQLTGQRGSHARFESELFERLRGSASFSPVGRPAVRDARDFIFETLLASSTYADTLLAADRRAAAGRAEYDDGYFEHWAREAGPVLTRRVADAIAATVAVIIGAWEQAGRPEVPVEFPRRPARIDDEYR